MAKKLKKPTLKKAKRKAPPNLLVKPVRWPHREHVYSAMSQILSDLCETAEKLERARTALMGWTVHAMVAPDPEHDR